MRRAARRSLILSAMLAMLLLAQAAPHAQEAPQAGSARTAGELMDAVMWGKEPIGGPFELTDHTGQRRTDADFRDKLMLVYFGFTFCPDVCPTDLLAMGLAVDQLGPAGEAVQPLFITVDPERDTPGPARQICSFFSSSIDRPDRQFRSDSQGRERLSSLFRQGRGVRRERIYRRSLQLHLSDGSRRKISRLLSAGQLGAADGRRDPATPLQAGRSLIAGPAAVTNRALRRVAP